MQKRYLNEQQFRTLMLLLQQKPPEEIGRLSNAHPRDARKKMHDIMHMLDAAMVQKTAS